MKVTHKFDCGQILCFLSSNYGDDVAVMKVLHLKRLSHYPGLRMNKINKSTD